MNVVFYARDAEAFLLNRVQSTEHSRRGWSRAVAMAAGMLAALIAFGPFLAVSVSAKEATQASGSSKSKAGHKTASKKGSKKAVARAPDTLFTAARKGDWSEARRLAAKTKDPIAATLVDWLYLSDSDVQPSFREINEFLAAHPGWPARGAMYSKAEQVIPDGMGPSEVLSWFASRTPKTGIGMVRLGEAKIALGDRASGEALIRKAWAEEDFASSDEREISNRHSAVLAGKATAARIDRFLASRRTTDATRAMADADSDTRAIAEARLTMLRSPAKAESVVASLQSRLRDDPGLVMEEMRAVRAVSDEAKALRFVAKATVPSAAESWWPERNYLAREALGLGRYQEAYQLAAFHGLSDGQDFADAEWLAGWIALRFLQQPDTALRHFRLLYAGVSYPVSKSRAAYWAGRCAETANRLPEAAAYYDVAAAFPTTYYGQLAAVKLGDHKAQLSLPDQPVVTTAQREHFRSDEVVRALRYAAAANEQGVARRFLLHLADRATEPAEFQLVGALAADLDYPGIAVRIAKTAMQSDVVLTELSYPLVSVPKTEGVETALVLGLSRQESEFNPRAVSSAGARGLMQLMPKTAQQVAKKGGIPYSASKLDEPAYNARLGTVYLDGLLSGFGGSYPLAIASYNAGPSRIRQWLQDFGDPRDPKVDAVDWVEMIPYSETRNYVQRVLENTQVYRARLKGGTAPLRIAEDLSRPGATILSLYSNESRPAVAIPSKNASPEIGESGPTFAAEPAKPSAPPFNPFGAGQPETTATLAEPCKRFILDAKGSAQCKS